MIGRLGRAARAAARPLSRAANRSCARRWRRGRSNLCVSCETHQKAPRLRKRFGSIWPSDAVRLSLCISGRLNRKRPRRGLAGSHAEGPIGSKWHEREGIERRRGASSGGMQLRSSNRPGAVGVSSTRPRRIAEVHGLMIEEIILKNPDRCNSIRALVSGRHSAAVAVAPAFRIIVVSAPTASAWRSGSPSSKAITPSSLPPPFFCIHFRASDASPVYRQP